MLKFDINGQALVRTDRFEPATDSEGYLQAGFTFSSDWNHMTKTALFWRKGSTEKYKKVLNSGGFCTVPNEVLVGGTDRYAQYNGNVICVSVFGVYGAVTATTNALEIHLNHSGYGEGAEPAAPTQSEYQQLATLYSGAITATENAQAECTDNRNILANAIKGNVSGAVVCVDDVSPVEHEPVVRVHGKNLLKPVNGAAWQCTTAIAADGKITLKNTETDGVAYARVGTLELKKGKTYVYTRYDPNNIKNVLTWKTGTTTDSWYPVNGVPYTAKEDVVVDVAVYMDDISAVGNTASIYIQIEEGTVATAYEPYIDPSSVVVKFGGRNLFGTDTSGDVSGTYRGWLVNPTEKDVVMSISDKDTSANITGMYMGLNENGVDANNGYTWIVEDGQVKSRHISEKFKYVSIFPNSDYAIQQLRKRFDIQVEYGTEPTIFEGYTMSEYTPAVDGTITGITSLSPCMTFQTDGAIIECEYNRDTNKVIERLVNAIVALGGTV